MRYKFFTNSERAWHGMFEAMENADESIYIEMYIFLDNMKAINFIELLMKKAKSGVRVRLVLDSFGSADLSTKAIDSLRKSGAEVRFFSSFLHGNHRKILIIDEKIAFVGGVNFHQNTKHWDDLVVRIDGRLVKYITRSFAKIYILCGGKDPAILSLSKNTEIKKVQTWFVEHSPGMGQRLKKIYKGHIYSAQKSIFLVTPYFMPKHWLSVALHEAILRGVKVEIFVPTKTDYYIVDRVNFFNMHRLAKRGVIFYLSPTMNHAKIMVIDEKEAMVGSQNLDFLSFGWNAEAGIFLKDLQAVSSVLDILKDWKSKSFHFDFKNYKPKIIDYIFFPFISFFNRIL